MRRFDLGLVLVAALAACSPGGGASTSSASSTDAASSVSSANAPSTTGGTQIANAGDGHDACHGDLTSVDMAPLLGTGPLTVNVDASNTSKCSFTAANNTAVQITLARGDAVQTTWDRVQASHGGNMVIVIGVGDAAQRTEDNTQLIARKGALLCQMDVVGSMSTIVGQSSVHDADGVNATLAALCAKVFDAEHA